METYCFSKYVPLFYELYYGKEMLNCGVCSTHGYPFMVTPDDSLGYLTVGIMEVGVYMLSYSIIIYKNLRRTLLSHIITRIDLPVLLCDGVLGLSPQLGLGYEGQMDYKDKKPENNKIAKFHLQ